MAGACAERWDGLAEENMKTLFSQSLNKVFGFFLLSACLAVSAHAQQAPNPPTNQDEVNKQLLRRLQELEDEVKQLKAQPAAVAAAPAPAPNLSPVGSKAPTMDVTEMTRSPLRLSRYWCFDSANRSSETAW